MFVIKQLHDKLMFTQLVKKLTALTASQGSRLGSRNAAIGSYPEPV
jgi:hypothetical protein